MNALIVGAGAVGQVFAWYLTQAGAKVTFFVRPTHAVPASMPMLVQMKIPTVLEGYHVTSSPEAVAAQPFDQVWLAVPSNTLSGAWLPRLLEATGQATVVCFAVEGEPQVPRSRLVMGGISFIAWPDPLPGHQGPERLAFYVPPLSRVPLSGDDPERVTQVRAALERGGCGVARVRDAARLGAPMTAILISTVAALEAAGWRFRDFKGHWSTLAARAAREVMLGDEVSWLVRLLTRGPLLRLAVWFSARWVPFDLEAYMQFHFSKVGEQTRVLFEVWRKRGRAKGTPLAAIEALRTAIDKPQPPSLSSGS